MVLRGIYSSFLVIISLNLFSQTFNYDKNYFRSPVDYTILLSANFAELRSGHFHSGIDIKTQGKIGKKIYACADGYISRVKITTLSYGKTLYIKHPNGLTTVYAHLSEFNLQLENYIKEKQYERKSYEINIFPDRDELPVKKGDIIALSGNSGYSFGPHLHFEIRNSANENPINPMLFNFNITDNVKPKIFSIVAYPKYNNSIIDNSTEKKRFLVKKIGSDYHLSQKDTLFGSGNLSFAIETNDYLNNSHNKCGVRQIDLIIDNEIIFSQTIDEFSFSETRYINSHMDYDLNVRKKKKIHKSFIEPNNKLSFYDKVKNNGIYNFNDTLTHKVEYIIKDTYLNTSKLAFYFKSSIPVKRNDLVNNTTIFPFDQSNYFDSAGIIVDIPEFALYDSLNFSFTIENNDSFYSPIYNVQDIYTPIHKRYNLSIEFDTTINVAKDKLLIATYDKKKKINPVGGEINGNKLKVKLRSFGSFFITADTLPPEIKPEKFVSKTDLSNYTYISFIIEDDLSGIVEYNGYIDDQWVLFEFDAKNDRLKYVFDEKMSSQKKEHTIKIELKDERGNSSEYKSIFYWQKIS